MRNRGHIICLCYFRKALYSITPLDKINCMLHLGELLFGQCKPAGIRSAGIYFWTAVIFSFLVQPVSAQVTPGDPGNFITIRSEERRVGKECRSRRAPEHQKTKKKTQVTEVQHVEQSNHRHG